MSTSPAAETTPQATGESSGSSHVVTNSDPKPKRASAANRSTIIGRPANACARCRSRKIKCTCEKPVCEACRHAKVDCDYPSEERPNWEYVRTLERRLNSMESTINTLSQDGARKRRRISTPRDHPPTPIPADPFPSVPLSSSLPSYNLAAPDPVTSHSRADVSPMASLDVVGLSGAPRGRARIRGRLTGGETLVVKPEDLPDKEEIDEALDYYFSFINPIFPIYHEPSMRTQVVSVYLAQVMASPQTLHDIYLFLALYTVFQERSSSNPSYCLWQGKEHWERAIKYGQLAAMNVPLARLQSTLLRLQYAFRDPEAASVWELTGAATRLAIDMELHHDPGAAGLTPFTALDIDLRRRVFWATCISDRKVSTALGRPCGLQNDWISTKYPSVVDDSLISAQGIRDGPASHFKETGIHHAKFHLFQFDIHERLNSVTATAQGCPPEQWFEEMRQRINEWRHGYVPDPAEWLNQAELDRHANIALSLLHRPCPGNPRPRHDSLVRAVTAAADVIRDYKGIWRKRCFNYVWIAIHHIFRAGVTYLNSLWIASAENWTLVPSYVQAILDIQTCSQLLEAMAARDRSTEGLRDAFETVSTGIIQQLTAQQTAMTTINHNPSNNVITSRSNGLEYAYLNGPPTRAGVVNGASVLTHASASMSGNDVPISTATNARWGMSNSEQEDGTGITMPTSDEHVSAVSALPNSTSATNAADTLQRFFANPFLDASAIGDLDFSLDFFAGMGRKIDDPEE